MIVIHAGRSDYRQMWHVQKELHAQVAADRKTHYLIITEHNPVITIGKSGDKSNLLADPAFLQRQGIDVIENDRGGDITFHGPGQIVAYPILNLEKFKKDIHWYLRALEDVIITLLAELGITAGRQQDLTGVWINNQKICAIGVKTSRWVTMHGLALNVTTNLDYFNMIIPCGITDRGVTSISEQLGNTMDINLVVNNLISQMSKIFQVKTIPGELSSVSVKIKE